MLEAPPGFEPGMEVLQFRSGRIEEVLKAFPSLHWGNRLKRNWQLVVSYVLICFGFFSLPRSSGHQSEEHPTD
jgi:hypothetical protein